jgi:succinate dehydrogenase subunit C
MTELRLYVLQRITALLMVPLILTHVYVIFHATANGLTANEILARTEGSIGWALFYGLFVLLAAIHGAIGVRTVLREWAGLGRAAASVASAALAVLLAALGARAVIAVVLPGGIL